MYRRVDEYQRMTNNEASENYPDNYIAVQRGSMDSDTGTVLYVGDNIGELITLIVERNEPFCGIVEGLNLQRSLGGVVVGG